MARSVATNTRVDEQGLLDFVRGAKVAGSGFPVLVKPNAWCASHVADFAVKNKHQRVRGTAAA